MSEKKMSKGSAVALGLFDGVHRGHLSVIEACVSSSSDGLLVPCVFTFSSSGGLSDEKYLGKSLICDSDKEFLCHRYGIKNVIFSDYQSIKGMTPQEFFDEVLVKKLHAKKLFCGEDFRFGYNCTGDAGVLKKLCTKENISLAVVDILQINGKKISTTEIKRLICEGNIVKANALLGYNYFIKGNVEKGNRIGRTLDFPTMNQHLPENIVSPKFGVYASAVYVDCVKYKAITNIGTHPTVGGTKTVVETYAEGYYGNAYGKEIIVELYDFMRSEKKFSGLEELKKQINDDIETRNKRTDETV